MLKFLVHNHRNIKGKSDGVANPTYIFSNNKLPWKVFILTDVIRGIVKQLSELVVFVVGTEGFRSLSSCLPRKMLLKMSCFQQTKLKFVFLIFFK